MQRLLKFIFGERPFEPVDFFQYEISPYLLHKKRLMFIYLTGALK